MTRIRGTFRIVLVLVGLAYAAVATSARAAQPAVVVEIESVSALMDAVQTVTTALGQPAPEAPMVHGALGATLKAPGLAGIATDRPVQLYVFLPALSAAGEAFDPTALAPRTVFVLPLQGDGAVHADAVGAMFPDSEAVGAVTHLSNAAVPGQELYMVTVGTRRAVGQDLETLQGMQELLSGQGDTPVVAFPGSARVRLDMQACLPYVEAASAQMLQMMQAEPMPPDMPMNPAKMLEAEVEGLVMLMRELRSYTLGIKVSPSAITIMDRITPMSGTKTASWIAGMTAPTPAYMAAMPENAMLASVGSGMDVMDNIMEPYAEIMGKIYGAMGPPMDQMGPLMRELMMSFKGIYAGDIAMGIVPAASGKGVGFVEVIALADAARAKQIIDEMYAGFNEDWGKAMPGFSMVQLDDRQHDGVTVQAFAYKIEAVTNQSAMAVPMMSMKWMEAMRWEMAFVGNDLVYTVGEPEIMDAALDRLKAGGTSITETEMFTGLFPKTKGTIVEAHTLSLCSTLKSLLGLIPGVDPAALAAIPDNTPGMAGYALTKGGNLIGMDRISLGEITALMQAIPTLGTSMGPVMQQLGIPGMPGAGGMEMQGDEFPAQDALPTTDEIPRGTHSR